MGVGGVRQERERQRRCESKGVKRFALAHAKPPQP
eukprot:COSAG01_NODE_52641_length_345_cov_0.804878_1_plen_34_part_01